MKDAKFLLRKNDDSKIIINELSDGKIIEINSICSLIEFNIKATISGDIARIVKLQNATHTIYALAFDKDRLKNKRILATEAATLMSIATDFENQAMLIAKKEEAHTKRLIHNLKSLTAKTMQEIFYVARQDYMLKQGKQAKNYVKQEIINNPDDAASAFISILKYQAAQNAEFSAFNKLNGDVGKIKKESHSIHKVLMNVFYLFFGDFTDKRVIVEIQPTHAKAIFDYESIHVCIYHIVENTAKYIKQSGLFNVNIITNTNGNNVNIEFDMESLAINKEEADKIFQEGYSGVNSVKNELHGSGIGLFIAQQLANLNGGNLYVSAGIPYIREPEYARNKFILTIPCK